MSVLVIMSLFFSICVQHTYEICGIWGIIYVNEEQNGFTGGYGGYHFFGLKGREPPPPPPNSNQRPAMISEGFVGCRWHRTGAGDTHFVVSIEVANPGRKLTFINLLTTF
jgi:hypothetical protein